MILCLTTLAVYFPVLDHDFVNYDDDFYVVQNLSMQRGLGVEGVRWAFTTFHGANWFPLTWLSWMLDYELYGLEPMGFHLTNLLLHGLGVCSLFLVLANLTGAPWRSAFVAFVFAIHPLHVESVAWVAERKGVLSGVFWILAVAAYGWYVAKPSVTRYLLVPVLLALGLMAKPVVVTLPFALLLLDAWPLGRLQDQNGSWRFDRTRIVPLVAEKLPLFAVIALFSGVTYIAQKSAGAVQSVETFSVGVRALNALIAYATYALKAVWPTNLSIYYPHPGDGVSIGLALISGALLAAVTVLVVVSAFKQPSRAPLAVGWLWFIGTLVPMIGLVQVGQQAMADRYTYIPYIGLAIVVAWGAPLLAERWSLSGKGVAGLGAAALVGLAVVASAQVRVWRDSVTLFEHALRVTDDNALAHINLGVAYLNLGRLDASVEELTEAIRIHPGAAEAHAALGKARALQGRPEDASTHFQTALRLDPESSRTHSDFGSLLLEMGDRDRAMTHFREAAALDPSSAAGPLNLGAALLREGRPEDAIESFRQAAALDPSNAAAHNNWGVALSRLGRLDDAEARFRRALELVPEHTGAHVGLASLAFERGAWREAATHYRDALGIDPDDAEARYGIGLSLASLGDFEGAAEHFERSVALEPDNPEAHFSLGLALAAQGQFETAIAHYSEALSLRPDYAEAHNSWGVALASQGRLDEALARFERAIALEPDLAEAHNNLGLAFSQKGELTRAVAHFGEAVSLVPQYADAHNNLGVSYTRLGRLAEAAESFRRAVEARPDHEQARRNLESTLAALEER